MLSHIRIQNVALIDEIEVDFSEGLNILSGETGAGKSIIIDSINFVLGERFSKDFLRSGENLAIVEALFFIENDAVLQKIAEMGVDVADDGGLLIMRSLNDLGKTSCKINGRSMTVSMLKEVSSLLVDIHGQHEHQSLLNPSKHIELTDRFCGEGLEELKNILAEKYKLFKEVEAEIKQISGESDRETRMEILKYQIDEIKAAKLKPGEDVELLERRKIAANSEKLITAAANAIEAINGGESGNESAIDLISQSASYIENIARYDESKAHFSERIESILVDLEELSRDLSRYFDTLDYEPSVIDNIENRLDKIFVLKRKYGNSVDDILDFLAKSEEKYVFLENSIENLNILTKKRDEYEKEIIDLCEKISLKRLDSAKKLSSEAEAVLKDLAMKDGKFLVEVTKKMDFNQNGFDKVEFLISPNLGEPLKPLSKIASGGEMSRVMLALKTVLAGMDEIPTFIFDEIDAGISGRTAQHVAEKLYYIAKSHQILCITHLPQIAAMGDSNYLIEKNTDNNKTVTKIKKLNEKEVVEELARLIGGTEITESTRNAALEMKLLTKKIKLTN